MSLGEVDGIPVLPASTIVIVDDRPDLHVLLLRRRTGSAFVGGMSVFPGGGLDPGDDDPGWSERLAGHDEASASAALGVESGGLAFWTAALRETYEESGILLTPDAVGPEAEALRRSVDADELPFIEAARMLDIGFDLSTIPVIARWITPIGPPRRYDTYVFLARLPAGQATSHDGVEAVAHEWIRPADALRRHEAGDLVMMVPTVCTLQQLAGYPSAADAFRVATLSRGPGGQAHTVRHEGGGFTVTVPGDPGHEEGEPVMGWMRLESNGRPT